MSNGQQVEPNNQGGQCHQLSLGNLLQLMFQPYLKDRLAILICGYDLCQDLFERKTGDETFPHNTMDSSATWSLCGKTRQGHDTS